MSRIPVVDLSFDQHQLDGARRLLDAIPRGIERATQRAIADATRTGKAEVSRTVRSVLDVRAASVRGRVFLRTIRNGELTTGAITISRDRLPSLISFGRPHDTRRRGVNVTIRRGQPRENFPHAFIRKGKGGVEQVFERIGPNRYPIRSRKGPSILSVFEGQPPDSVVKTRPGLRALAAINETLAKRLDAQVNYELLKATGQV